MPQKPGRSYRRAYLDEFKRDAAGQYVYGGRHYELCGDAREKNRFRVLLVVFLILVAGFTAAPECFPPVPMSVSFITLLPWLAQVIAVFLAEWSGVRLVYRGSDLRAYVYEATVLKLPRRAAAAAILCGVTFAAQCGYLIAYGAGEDPLFALIRLPFAPLCALSCLALRFLVRKSQWKERE